MTRAFTEIAFTDAVKAAQTRYGSRQAYARFELSGDRHDQLTDDEISFLARRDSSYMSTVSENGWPYIQHRGGPEGFIKVLDTKTIGFADYRGNKQYISVGNLSADDRVMLITMDYPNRQRLKIWARAHIVHRDEDPELVDRLTVANYSAKVERGIIMTIAAVDWNCSQHITPRYTEDEIERLIAPLLEENRMLKAQLEKLHHEHDK